MEKVQSVSKKTLREQIADILRKKILSGSIKPGERLIEAEIAEMFQVSRGPVREALRQLEEEGLSCYLPYKGCVVREFSYKDMQEAYLIRSTLETLAVEVYESRLPEEYAEEMEALLDEMAEAARERDIYRITSADERFHCCIVEASGLGKLLKMWKLLESDNSVAYLTMNREVLLPFERVEVNHRYLLEGLKTNDMEEACRRIREHYMCVPKELYRKKYEGIVQF